MSNKLRPHVIALVSKHRLESYCAQNTKMVHYGSLWTAPRLTATDVKRLRSTFPFETVLGLIREDSSADDRLDRVP
ncbi:hypothetical protein IG631_24071 [Alternaria alternata]|nr:hypothetical protein IG631_24071 [Alternaria alternata]